MTWAIWLAIAAAVLTWSAAARHRTQLKLQTRKFLARFAHLPLQGAFREGLTRTWFGAPRVDHAVLLVHGFSASPNAFEPLLAELERCGIPYMAPALTGSGLDDFALLEAARGADWRRDVHTAYDVLAALATDVSVVAISFGTLVAAELALERPVRHMVLVAPYFHLKNERDRLMRARLQQPWFRKLALALKPIVAKPIRAGRSEAGDIADPVAAARFFQYPTLPLSGLLAVWDYPSIFALGELKCQTLDILYGALDATSDVPMFLADLATQKVPHRVQSFANSGHNLFSDSDAADATRATATILNGEP